jgi:hypothetical protein
MSDKLEPALSVAQSVWCELGFDGDPSDIVPLIEADRRAVRRHAAQWLREHTDPPGAHDASESIRGAIACDNEGYRIRELADQLEKLTDD